MGLGTYQDIYLRFQPAALEPGRVYYTYAHNDLLQLVLELGLAGTALMFLAFWRTGRDLVGAHLLGRGGCPVGGGEAEGARRSDPLQRRDERRGTRRRLALLFHSLFDFGARIPANGILAATCFGIATVALHTRYGPTGERLLIQGALLVVRGPGRPFRFTLGAAAVLLALVLALWIVRAPVTHATLRWRRAAAPIGSPPCQPRKLPSR